MAVVGALKRRRREESINAALKDTHSALMMTSDCEH